MTHKLLNALSITAALLVLHPQANFAQANLQQQMPGLSGQVHGQSHSDAASAVHSAGLGMVPEDFAQLKLAPGFLIGLKVLDDGDFQGSFRVDQEGDIALPILGSIHVAGETASEARDQIRKRLLTGQILKDPQVDLTVLEYTAPQVTIIGEVSSPGKYPLLVPRRLVDVLALAGGPSPLAGNEVSILRGTGDAKPVLIHYSKDMDPQTVADVFVDPGDTVQVKRAGIIYVLGAVNRPGGYIMQENGTLNVLQAISLASGTSIAASTGTIYLLRKNGDGTEINIALPYKKISRGKRADVQLHATDVLFVPTSTMKSIMTNSQAVLSSAASAAIYAGVVY
jgi:polysaccharide export outer membrane protein